MKILQFNLSDFNPDCMNDDEIRQWLAFIGQGVRPQVAKQWFPDVKGQYRIVRDMRNYLWNKLTATRCRLDGKITDATEYKAICDRIYSSFPESVKW